MLHIEASDERRLSLMIGFAGPGDAQGMGMKDLEPQDPSVPNAHHPSLWMLRSGLVSL